MMDFDNVQLSSRFYFLNRLCLLDFRKRKRGEQNNTMLFENKFYQSN